MYFSFTDTSKLAENHTCLKRADNMLSLPEFPPFIPKFPFYYRVGKRNKLVSGNEGLH